MGLTVYSILCLDWNFCHRWANCSEVWLSWYGWWWLCQKLSSLFLFLLGQFLNIYVSYVHNESCILEYIGAVVVVIVCYLDLQLSMQSVPITTKVVSLNPSHGEVYSIQHYVITFHLSVTCGRSVVFSWYSGFHYQYNWQPQYSWNIIESGVKHHNPNPLYVSYSHSESCILKYKAFFTVYWLV